MVDNSKNSNLQLTGGILKKRFFKSKEAIEREGSMVDPYGDVGYFPTDKRSRKSKTESTEAKDPEKPLSSDSLSFIYDALSAMKIVEFAKYRGDSSWEINVFDRPASQ